MKVPSSIVSPASGPSFERAEMLARLRAEPFDLLVVGGGITGVGVALDAASRGLRTALVERDDFASGTSSKSSKLIHGGLRYLQQGEVRLVYEALHERQRLRRNAPHLVKVMPFMIPILGKPGAGQGASVVSRKIARALGSAMWMYDITGGWRIGKMHHRLRRRAALAHMPTMTEARLLAAYLYYDATADDARLVLTVARTAAAHGAAVANGCGVVELTKAADGRTNGAIVEADGVRFPVRASTIVNAAGVWSDEIRTLDEGLDPDSIRPAKGVHVTVAWAKVRNDVAVIIPVPRDKRSLFLVPWGRLPDGTFQHTYVGTTDTDYSGPLDDPQCTKDDIDYILRALNGSIDSADTGGFTEADITGAWAGLRPLVKRADAGRTADLSRRHAVSISDHGVVSVTGGKLTTYRDMAEDAVDAALDQLGRHARCTTRRLRFVGADGFRTQPQGSIAAHLYDRHGGAARHLLDLIAADAALGQPLVPGLPYLRVEAVHAVNCEMTRTLDDVLTRRTRARLLDRAATLAAAPSVAELLAPLLGWDDVETARQLAAFVQLCETETTAGLVSEEAFIASISGGTR